jgi:uncharacterized protein (TIGR01244 family)
LIIDVGNEMKNIVIVPTLLVGLSCVIIAHAEQSVEMKSEAIIQEFQSTLKKQLVTAMKSGGPTKAINVCKTEAPIITQALSHKHNVALERVSRKFRNPVNKPDDVQLAIINYMATTPSGADTYYQELPNNQAVYGKKITVGKVCLTCHGPSIEPVIEKTLDKNYPHDLAKGYQLGDMRGIFSVKWSSTKNERVGIKNFKKIDGNLWVGGQPTIAQIDKLKNMGVKRIINLRSDKEMKFNEATVVKQLGIEYFSIPISGAKDISYENSIKVRTLLDSADGPVFLHCASANRVGAVLALDAHEQGLNEEQSLIIGKASGLSSLEKRVSKLITSQNR